MALPQAVEACAPRPGCCAGLAVHRQHQMRRRAACWQAGQAALEQCVLAAADAGVTVLVWVCGRQQLGPVTGVACQCYGWTRHAEPRSLCFCCAALSLLSRLSCLVQPGGVH